MLGILDIEVHFEAGNAIVEAFSVFAGIYFELNISHILVSSSSDALEIVIGHFFALAPNCCVL